MNHTDIVYRVNKNDEIIYVNDEWQRFAAANRGASVAPELILNRSLWNFIVDETTREVYRQLLKQVRAGYPMIFNFRCDSPTQKRLLEMDIHLKGGGLIEFRTRALSQNSHTQPLIDKVSQNTKQDSLWMCGWCKKILVDHQWLEVDGAVAKLELLEKNVLPPITYGMCDACYENMSGKLMNPASTQKSKKTLQ